MNRFKRVVAFFVFMALIAGISVSGLIIAAKKLYPVKYKDSVIKYSAQYDLDPYMVFSVIKAESNFKSNAVSPKKAVGLMQITESTGMWAAEKMNIEGFKINDLYDPDTNIKIGCWYLSYLKKRFEKFDNTTDEEKKEYVLAAYNGSQTNVLRWIKNKEESGSGVFCDNITFKETKEYVKRVKGNYDIYRKLYKNIEIFSN